jgi:hypothetical protein
MSRSISDKIGEAPAVPGLRVMDQMYPKSNPGTVVHVITVLDGKRQVGLYDLMPFE